MCIRDSSYVLPNHKQLGEEDLGQLLRLWLSYLPLQHDRIEMNEAHLRLVSAVLGYSEVVLGSSLSNLPTVVRTLFDIVQARLGTAETLQSVSVVLNQMSTHQQMGPVVHETFEKFTPEQQAKIKAILSPHNQSH
eukprot:TRINITY_DN6944_c0_g1_i6.p1 TRINITY_DN6944_c0_g1~~TRINITY_DN6944_c0_g1_i6.p1  ORF type:complete len:151 (-),score=35.68 TRINITY_DN6944_c0_g1_i6:136-540(-)